MIGDVIIPPRQKLEDLIRLAELCVDLLRQNEEFYAEVSGPALGLKLVLHCVFDGGLRRVEGAVHTYIHTYIYMYMFLYMYICFISEYTVIVTCHRNVVEDLCLRWQKSYVGCILTILSLFLHMLGVPSTVSKCKFFRYIPLRITNIFMSYQCFSFPLLLDVVWQTPYRR